MIHVNMVTNSDSYIVASNVISTVNKETLPTGSLGRLCDDSV